MAGKTKKSTGLTPARVIRSFVIIVALAAFFGVTAKVSMDALNKKMGIDTESDTAESDTSLTGETVGQEEVVMPEFDPAQEIETVSSVWVPDWKATPCSLFIASGGEAMYDSLPQAPQPSERNTELQLLVEMWAGYSGYSPLETERIWVFASGDTCFVDLPRSGDWQGIVETIEGRFISYTVMYPFVAGEIVEGFEEGIPVRGLASNR